MTDVTIDQLALINSNQLRSAVNMIQQEGVSFQAPTRPNPPTQINVTSQSQLEADLGTDLEIADGEAFTIVIDAGFTLAKPFKLGLNSALELYSSVNDAVLTYTGTGALFQNTNPANDINTINLHNLLILGDGTNSVFDIVGASIVQAREVIFEAFDSIGIIDNPFVLFDSTSLVNNTKGLIMKDPSSVSLTRCSVVQFGAFGMTAFTIQTNVVSVLDADVVRALSFFAGDSLFFLDPNAPSGGIYSIQQSDVAAGDVYQPGSSIAVTLVIDNTSGNPRFTAAAHGFVVGRPVVLSGFTEPYNGTFIVTAVTTNTFDVAELTFTANDTNGSVNAKSLDNTDLLVLARGNITSPDSMFNGESGLEVFASPDTSSVLAQNAFEVVTNVAWLFNNLERFSEGVVNTGQLVCDDPKSRSYTIVYSGTIEKSGGGALNAGVTLLKNGVNVAFNPPHTVLTSQVQISGSDIIQLIAGDTIDIAVINYDLSATAIDTSQLSLVVSKS